MKKLAISLLTILMITGCNSSLPTDNPSSGEDNPPVVDPTPVEPVDPVEPIDPVDPVDPIGPVIKTYTIKFVNYDGSVLQVETLDENTIPVFKNANPTKPDEDNYSYQFTSWSPAITKVTKDQTYTATFNAVEKPVEVFTVAEVKELCKELKNLNESGIEVGSKKVTIKGLAISKFSLVKTTSKFGLDLSSPYKILFGDSTGTIVVASNYTNDGNSLWGKIGDHAGKDTSSYTVTGVISMYLGQPEIYINGETFAWDSSLNIKVDYKQVSNKEVSLVDFYEEAIKSSYNCAGHGYGDIITVKDVKCFDKRDNVYFFTDGNKVMKVAKGLGSYSIGNVYDITGYVSLSNWIPSLYTLKSEISNTEVDDLTIDDCIEKTITDFKKNKSSKDDTSLKMDAYIKSFMNVYKSTVYANAYTENGKWYVTMGDNYDDSTEYSVNHLINHIAYEEVAISNDNYWNCSYDQMDYYCPLSSYIGEQEQVEVCYFQYLQEWGSYSTKKNQPIWKVMIINNLLDF